MVLDLGPFRNAFRETLLGKPFQETLSGKPFNLVLSGALQTVSFSDHSHRMRFERFACRMFAADPISCFFLSEVIHTRAGDIRGNSVHFWVFPN